MFSINDIENAIYNAREEFRNECEDENKWKYEMILQQFQDKVYAELHSISMRNDSLEDWINILERNEPNKRKNIQKWDEWLSLLTEVEEELSIEDERPLECERIIKEIKKFVGWER